MMARRTFLPLLLSLLVIQSGLSAHCQMPCGIYHDELVLSSIDQYIETMNKAASELNSIKFDDPQTRSQFVRWVMNKEDETKRAGDLLVVYFLQQKVKPDAPNAQKLAVSLHKLLFLMVKIKQETDVNAVKNFTAEWNSFKQLYQGKEE